MNKLITIIGLITLMLSVSINNSKAQPCGQPPFIFTGIIGINYQAVIRDTMGNPIKNKKVSIVIALVYYHCVDICAYSETFNVKTNEFGLVNLVIGNGTPGVGDYSKIYWREPYEIWISADTEGGTNYKLMGKSYLASVPYSMLSTESLRSDVSASIPTMSSDQRDSIQNPKAGMQILNTTTKSLDYYNGIGWREISGTCVPQPPIASTGPDQLDLDGTSTNLTNNKAWPAYGKWTVESGTGGNLTWVSDTVMTFTGIAGNAYVLRWTISNDCSSSYADVNVSFNP